MNGRGCSSAGGLPARPGRARDDLPACARWAIIGAGVLVAARPIACFRELESKPFADYYLVGTLTSLLVAFASGILVRCAVGP